MSKLLRKRSKSKDKETIQSEQTTDAFTSAHLQKPAVLDISSDISLLGNKQNPPDHQTTATMSQTTKNATNRKLQKIPDELLELAEYAEELPEEDYGEIITREDGSPIYYFGGTKFTNATKAIWKVDNKIYALDPRRVNIPEENENIYERPDYQKTTRNFGEKQKTKIQQDQEMHKAQEPYNLTEQINIIKQDINDMKSIKQDINDMKSIRQDISDMMITIKNKSEPVSKQSSKNVSPVRNISRSISRKSSRHTSPIRNYESDHEDYTEYNQKQIQNQVYTSTKQESIEERFSRFLIQKSKLVNHLTQLQHKQGPSYTLWLQGLKDEMKLFAMPEEFFIPLAIRKLPDEIRSDIIAKKVKTPKELNEALYNIYCETKNAISLKGQFFKENKMAPHDRNYNNLRTTIKRTQTPMIVSVERIGHNDTPSIRERLVEDLSEKIAIELFLNAIQNDAKQSILNKGRYESLDEVVKRANDFASSIQNEYY